MFDITKDPAGFTRLTISGRIDADEMRAGLDAFLEAIDDGEQTPFLYTIKDFEFPPLNAIAVEFGYLPRLMTCLSKIGRVALIADQQWLRTAAEVEGKLIPGLTIKSYEPGEEEILRELLPRAVATQIFSGLLENGASEQGARMSAMDNATRNAGDMIEKLTIQFNRTRQAVITNELIEIISGAEAL